MNARVWFAASFMAACLSACQILSGLSDLEADRPDDAGVRDAGGGGTGGREDGGADGSAGMDAEDSGASGAGGSSGEAGRPAAGSGGAGAGGQSASGSGGAGGQTAGSNAARSCPPEVTTSCDPAMQCGCAVAENCTYVNDQPACVASGTIAPYQACEESKDCTTGHQCVGGACKRSCANSTDASCEGDNTKCFQVNADGVPISGRYVCGRTCNPAHPQTDDARFDACGTGLTCLTSEGSSDCALVRTAGQPGDACEFSTDCAPGSLCLSGLVVDWCEKWCEIGKNDCAAGATCVSLEPKEFAGAEVEFGYCCKPPTGLGPCDTAPQCGCPDNQACRTVNLTDGTTACQAVGNVEPYQPCTATTQCSRSFDCIGGLCRALCDPTIENYCGADARCNPAFFEDVQVPGAFFCEPICNPANPFGTSDVFLTCPPGVSCIFADDWFSCQPVPAGAGSQGASCDDGTGSPSILACAPRHFCDVDTLTCTQYCEVGAANTCSVGTCRAFTEALSYEGVQFGFCG